MGALPCGSSHLGGHHLRIPDRRDHERNEALRVRAAPLLDVPIVVCLHHREREVLVVTAREELAAELWERREAHRAEYAVRVHVLDALVDIPGSLADVVERRGFDSEFLLRAAGDRVQRDVGDFFTVEDPPIAAVVFGDESRRAIDVLRRQAIGEHVRRFDHVVVHAHQDQVLGTHRSPSSLISRLFDDRTIILRTSRPRATAVIRPRRSDRRVRTSSTCRALCRLGPASGRPCSRRPSSRGASTCRT